MRRFVLGVAVVAGLGMATLLVLRPASPPSLGPVDGHDLPPTDLERVAVGSDAPDFTLRAFPEGVVTLSDYRGRKDVVLVFYRGHW